MVSLMYRSFGAQAPRSSGLDYAMLWLLGLAFVAASVVILAFLNFFALFFGVTVNFLGRNGVKFTFVQLFRRIPAIALTMPVLIGYGVWFNARLGGLAATVLPAFLTAVLAVGLLAGIVFLNTLMGRSKPNGSEATRRGDSARRQGLR